ncbi:MAG: helix-turn-helix domain-containing protein [Clostridium sp.]|nr:helix-turn-helix domain-containing protein [Clostridium sp.]
MKIGESILHIRKGQEMTQEEFASIFAVTRQTVSNWEKEKSYPDLQTLVEMSNRFGVSLDNMLKEDVDIVKKIDRERKFSKYVKRGALLFGGIFIILCVIWSILWYDAKQESEKRFQSGIEQFGFTDNLSENLGEEGYQYPYRLEADEEAVFYLADLVMSEWFDISYLGCYNQVLMCRVQREEGLLQIEWNGSGADFETIYVYDKKGKHLLTDMETKKLLRDDEQLKEINTEAHEMCRILYVDYKWFFR